MPQPEAAPWGHLSRHYASLGARPSDARDDELADLEKRWAHLVLAAMPKAREQVEQAFRQWNGIVRDQLRNEMGLRLSVGGEVQSVPVRIVDGLPKPLAVALGEFPNWEWVMLHRPDVEATVRGVQLLARHHDEAKHILGSSASMASKSSLIEVASSAEHLLERFDKLNAIKRIVDCQEDVLGSYHFRVPEVRLYWVPISIVSRLLGIPVDALTLVVLAHELAHAYSHLGRDIDGEAWNTNTFANTDIAIVEGIAQFYAQVICESLNMRFPTARHAFETLLSKQSGAYTAYRDWLDSTERSGEIMRVAMIECRSRNTVSQTDFASMIDRHRQQVKGRPAKLRSGGSAHSFDTSSGVQ
jgi:hypothetical protein